MSNACIVGNGPSIMLEPMGDLIDGYDTVIRLKRCQNQLEHPEYFGKRTDILGGSLTIAGGLRDISAEQYWVFMDSRHENTDPGVIAGLPRMFPKPVLVDEELCNQWDELYRAARMPADFHPQMAESRSCDDLGEKHLSQGFKGILYAAKHLDVEEIILVGFDNVMTGDFHWSMTRGPEWNNYPRHRWDVEHGLLSLVEEEYGVKIGFLIPEDTETQDEKTTLGYTTSFGVKHET